MEDVNISSAEANLKENYEGDFCRESCVCKMLRINHFESFKNSQLIIRKIRELGL